MSRLDSDQRCRYIKNYGWSYYESDENSWVSGWQTDKRAYPLSIELSDTCLELAVEPLIKLDIEWNLWPDIVQYILELNQHIQLAKLSLLPEGSVALSCQILTKDLSYDNFSEALGIIGYYAEDLYDRLFERIFKSGLLTHHSSKFLT